jgi:hypothetical protein
MSLSGCTGNEQIALIQRLLPGETALAGALRPQGNRISK